MTKPNKYYSVKGFTLTEVLVTLALTSIVLTLSYSTLNYTQKLFHKYKDQNQFLNAYTELKKRMDYEALNSNIILEESPNVFTIKRDSSFSVLEIKDQFILFKKGERCDTFKFPVKKIDKTYELMANPTWINKLIKTIEFETEFTKQKYNFVFKKDYDTSIKLELELQK